MSRLLLSAAVTGATVHAALVQATRPELTFTAQLDPKHGLVGVLDMKNNTRVPLSFEDGRYSAQRASDSCAHVSTLEGIGKLRSRIVRPDNNQWCFQVLDEFFWAQMRPKQQRLQQDPGDTCNLAIVQFGYADTLPDVLRIAKREATALDAKFLVTCSPFPRLVPGYTIEHSFNLAEII
jgi:hypothetical protein